VKVFLKMMKGKLISLANHIFMVSLVYLTYLKVVHAELEPKEDSPESKTVASVSSTYNGPGNLMGVENFGFIHALVASFSVILVSEIGDKTFFIAAIMAMRHPRMTVFAGAITALALMTILSALFGWLANVKLFNLIICQVPQSLNIALCDVCVGKSERKIKQFS
jgi:hypothetical protein